MTSCLHILSNYKYLCACAGEYKLQVFYDRIRIGDGVYRVHVGSKKVFIRDVKPTSFVGVEEYFLGS